MRAWPSTGPSADGDRKVDRLAAPGSRFLVAARDHELLPERSDDACARFGRRVGRHERDGGLVLDQSIVSRAHVPEEPGQALVKEPRGDRIDFRVDLTERVAHQRQRAIGTPTQLGHARREVRQIHPRHGDTPRRVGHAVPQLERPLAVRERLRERVHPLGCSRRIDRGRQRPLVVVGREPVARDLADPLGLAPVEQRRRIDEQRPEPCMKSGALAGQQIVVDRLLHEGMAEGVPGRLRHEHLVLDGDAEVFEQPVLPPVAQCREQRVREAPSDHRGGPQKLAGRLRGSSSTRAQKEVAQRRGTGTQSPFCGCRYHFLGEERFRFRSFEDGVDEDSRRLRTRRIPASWCVPRRA